MEIWTPTEKCLVNGELCFKISELKKIAKVDVLIEGSLWTSYIIDGDKMEFAFFDFSASELNSKEDDFQVNLIFCGTGFLGFLKECRHTYWGDEEGYIFYPNSKYIKACLNWLEIHFDMI